jgi:CBS domain-containing protein
MKQVKDIMTAEVACCIPQTPLNEVAQLMVRHAVGCIPVVESLNPGQVVGVVTDRDITCRTLGAGLNPMTMTAGEVMSHPVATVTPTTSLEQCCQTMEQNKVRRVPVIDETGACCGIVAQADIATKAAQRRTAEVVREVSQPMPESSQVAAGA